MWESILFKELGFEDEEVDAIVNRFDFRLDPNDWESIQVVDYELEDDDNHLNLPTNRLVYFPDELIRKNRLAQID